MGQRHGGCLWLDRDNIDGCKGSRIGWRKIIQDYKVQFGRESSRLLPSIWSYSKWLGNTTNIISPKVWDLWWTWTKVEDGCSAVRPKAKGSTMLYWLERLFVKGYILDVKAWTKKVTCGKNIPWYGWAVGYYNWSGKGLRGNRKDSIWTKL